ncbi:MAG: rhodoquinone biosynthesis methyltransferase RquA [Alphaproteobacteria bacterium]|nr:rhodoquinone biosynthesis methyltransferase RquA [Alphaproteobacteria bacterium]MDE1986986.1 rhodoquinone biosynthesis methyltransferase RquA [Alphaproteobacteria bacterium]MDE2162990.1 rhodoquinone biosynthesis methyltransferase RquA [Alphaproteobacteria bacterium]MDE2267373.1 rhodoquinone biosynthesis methyltransferase RquA [Alphaproteobacteria bacterium]MDE2499739.1 rhodoquinone biosynthesis methyltransferase RquA [Alphaproteobacteria bacterium]
MDQQIDDIGQLALVKPVIPYADDTTAPDYLLLHYWWAYAHPWAVKFFDRHWIINLILLGNYRRLRDVALTEFGKAISGNTLQLACVYGDLTCQLARRVVAGGGNLDIVDILPIQLRNLKWKLPCRSPVRLLRMDTTALELRDESYDRVLLYFLLHEQPASERKRTLREALRVVKPGGKVMVLDFASPYWWNPLRYIWRPLLALLEPFALDLWRTDIAELLPPLYTDIRRERFFGGFFQKIVITR